MSVKCLVILGLACVFAEAQVLPEQRKVHAEPAAADSELPLADLAITKLVISPGKPVPGVERSNVIVRPIQCSAEGGALIQIPLPPDYLEMRVVSLTPSGGRVFDFKTIPDLYDLTLLSFFPSDKGVNFLFYASEENKNSDYRKVTDKGKVITGNANMTEHHQYLVRFGQDGRYRSTVRLAPGLLYFKIAELSSGELLLLSYDQTNRTPQLQLADPDGKAIRPIPLQGEIVDDPAIKKGESGNEVDTAAAEHSVSGWQFISAKGRVLLYRPHARSPVLEIGNGGFVREVPVEAPPGYELDSFISSTKTWFARFRRSNLSLSGHTGIDASPSSGNFVLAELNPSDGSVRRLFKIESASFFSIACEVDGRFLSYSTDLGSEFLLSYTDVPN